MGVVFEQIANYIIKKVQRESSSFQYIVDYNDIEEEFNVSIRNISDHIINALCDREEVADVIADTDGFDVVLYTDYAPNY